MGYRAAKRAFDIVFSGAAIAVLAVPSLVLSAVIAVKSPGASPIYTQERVGRIDKDGNPKTFKMFKFRSMIPHADEMLDELQDQNEADGPLFKIKNDPRIIPGVGHFIRRHSIDELPQFINCFIGQLSLVGPRPALPKEVAEYSEEAMQRLTVKPGLTGYWQVQGRSAVNFDDMVQFDLDYINDRSFATDLKCIGKTVGVVFTGNGAY